VEDNQGYGGIARGGVGIVQKGIDVPVTAPATPEASAWQGWGTALKPAWEPILMARKPLEGTVAANLLKHGTGAINVDGCRIGAEVRHNPSCLNGGSTAAPVLTAGRETAGRETAGRWPANFMHDGSPEVLAGFPLTGVSAGGRTANISKTSTIYGGGKGLGQDIDAAAVRGDPGYGDSGSAARFFYCAKASRTDREEGNTHPTVKPTALMRYLCRLVTPRNGVVLDPFCGSGSTGKAAIIEGFRFVGIDLDSAHVAIAEARCQFAVESVAEQAATVEARDSQLPLF